MSARHHGANWRHLIMAIIFGLMALTVTACDDGPAEEAGSEAGAAVDNAGEAAESAGDAIEEKADDAADAIGDAADDAGDAVEKATD